MGIISRISARQRITIGLVGLMVGTLLIASAVGFFPNEQKEILQGRAKLCESLAISSTAMASAGQFAILKGTLDSVVNRDEGVLSIGLRTEDDGLLVTAGSHEENWVAEAGYSIQQMQVPVYRQGEHWARLEVCFRGTGGLLGLNYWAPAWLLVVVVPACFVQFNFYLRKTLKQLNQSDRVPQHVQDALDRLSVGLVLMDECGQILFCNAEFARSIGRTADDLRGARASDLNWQEDDDSGHGLPWEEAAASGRPVDDRILRMLVSRRQCTFSVNCSTVGQGMMATFDDITLLEEARETAQQASESKSSFLANMSHEIRTPLNAVLGFTDVLRRGLVTDSDESLDHLNMIHRSGKHLLELINDILDLSKIEAGRMEVESIDTRVDQVILDTIDVLGVRAKEKDLDLRGKFASSIPRVIQSDPTRLRQIITNLIGNAIKFTQQGSITVATQLIDGDAPQLQIEITDTGIGMTPEQQAMIFESFSQADASTTRKFGGTGLGLSISRRLSEALGGALTVSSQPGSGSTFTIVLPVDAKSLDDLLTVDEIVSNRVEKIAFPTDSSLLRVAAKKVLVVDDGESNRRLIELVLGRAGAHVTSVDNGLEAIKVLSQDSFDLIFMDMQMPVMDGYTATGRIRSVGLDTPVIALTGNAMKGDRERCIEAGCNDFLSKPVEIDLLLQRTAHFIGTAPQKSSTNGGESTRPQSAATEDEASAQVNRFDGAGQPIHSTLPMDDDDFREIVDDFVERLESRLDGISRSLATLDFDAVRNEAHWLKGAGGTVGFPAFTEPARALEQAAKASDADQATLILQSICDIQARLAPTSNASASPAEPEVTSPEDPAADSPSHSESTNLAPIHCTLPLDDPEFCQIVADFIDRLDVRLEQMRRFHIENQFEQLSEEAHWLKGTGGTLGYAEFAEPAAGLVQAANAHSSVEAQQHLERVLAVRRRIVVPSPNPSESD